MCSGPARVAARARATAVTGEFGLPRVGERAGSTALGVRRERRSMCGGERPPRAWTCARRPCCRPRRYVEVEAAAGRCSNNQVIRFPGNPRDGYVVENTCIKLANSLEEPRWTVNIIQPRLQPMLLFDRKIKDA